MGRNIQEDMMLDGDTCNYLNISFLSWSETALSNLNIVLKCIIKSLHVGAFFFLFPCLHSNSILVLLSEYWCTDVVSGLSNTPTSQKLSKLIGEARLICLIGCYDCITSLFWNSETFLSYSTKYKFHSLAFKFPS